ncbi:MAG TPA: hypothetical protein VH353_07960 [Caulobacteraceae bacterium]|jgi:hypothetical protein|nr:hypothetical protein [Caulobacteraceae bacterium]
MTSQEPTAQRDRDFLARPSSALFWWGFPLLAGFATNALPISPTARTVVWAAAFAWMGMGCTLNARRCRRRHCYISAPVLFLGAVAVAATALGLAPLGPRTAGYVINATLGLALLSFLAEPVWGRYRAR